MKKYFYFRCQKLIFDSELLSIWQRPQNTEVDCVRLGMHGHTQPKVLVSYACNIYLTNISMKKIKDIHAFLPEIFLIRKSCKAEFVKQNFSQIWDLHRGTENFKIFWFRLLPAKVTTKFYEGSETKFKKNSEILHFGSFLVVLGQKKFLESFFFFFFKFLGLYCCLKFQEKLVTDVKTYQQKDDRDLWRRVVVVTTTSQLHSTKSELRFCAGSNPASGV